MKKIAFVLALILINTGSQAAEPKSAYDRVIETGTLRCGYATWEPGVYKDPNDGRMKGLFVEIVEEMARMSKIKVEWAAEVDWGQIPEALRSGKVDAFCNGMAADAARAKNLTYIAPMSYMSVDVVVRSNDNRFPSGRAVTLEDLNKPEFATAYTEGDVLETIKQTELPNVKGVALPPLGTPADNLMHVLTKKTDLVIFPRVIVQNYEKVNGTGKLKILKMKTPLRVYGNVIAVDAHDRELKNFLDAAMAELIQSSSYDRIMKPYEQNYPGAFMRPKLGYDLIH